MNGKLRRASGRGRVIRQLWLTGFGADGAKERPHCRQIVVFAATYSICLKPQCGHSTLALAGDDLVTSSGGGEGQSLRAREGRFG